MEMNIWKTRVHFDMDAWWIITVCGVSAFTVDTQTILQRGSGFLRDCLRWRQGAQASRLTNTKGKGSFHIILFKAQRVFMLDKCIPKN